MIDLDRSFGECGGQLLRSSLTLALLTGQSFRFLAVTWRAYLQRLGLPLSLQMERPGFYPRGGGIVDVEIPGGAQLRGLTLTARPPITTATIMSAVASLPESIAERQAKRARFRL